MSEAGSGSDVVSMKTTAEKKSDVHVTHRRSHMRKRRAATPAALPSLDAGASLSPSSSATSEGSQRATNGIMQSGRHVAASIGSRKAPRL